MNYTIAALGFALLALPSCHSDTAGEHTPVPNMAMDNPTSFEEVDYTYKQRERNSYTSDVSFNVSANSTATATTSTQSAERPSASRKIIRTGEINFETSNISATQRQLKAAADACKGYLSRDEATTIEGSRKHTLHVRIPAEKFDLFLSKVTSVAGNHIDSRNIYAQDVTEEFIDTEARIKTKKELERRYAELLNHASNVKDMLEIEREMGMLREDIESMEGHFNYLKDKVAFGTLTISFYEPGAVAEAPGFFTRIGHGISRGWQSLLGFVIGLIAMWPFWVLVLSVWIVIRKLLRRRANRMEQEQQSANIR